MKNLSILALLVSFAAPAFAGDTPAVTASAAEKSGAMHSVACPDPCSFEVKSRDEKELMSIVKAHAKKHHKMALTDAKIKEMMKTQ